MKKKRIIIIAVIVVVIALVVLLARGILAGMQPVQLPVETTVLTPTDLKSTVSVTGTVESQTVEKVYARLNYPVEELNVQVGDVVAEGDILCVLDTSSLENTIAQERASVNATQQTTGHNVNVAEKQYNSAKSALEQEYDSQVNAAQQVVDQAESRMEKAGIAVREARAELKNGRDDDLDDEEIAQLKRREQTAAVDYESAKTDLDYAKQALDSTRRNAREKLEEYQDLITTAQISGNSVQTRLLAIQKLEQDLLEASMSAPAKGTVTAVYTDKGAPSSGLMFVIEDTEKLKIVTKIKEYDIADVYVGAKVEIRSDSTGGEIFEGRVSHIAPTSIKNEAGDSVDSNDAEFETEIEVLTPDSGLRIGANARVTIIVQEKQAVFTVPYEAIGYSETGEEVVYITQLEEDGTRTAQPVVVETGLESDFNVEIITPELGEGDEVLSNAIGVYAGMPVLLYSDLAEEGEDGGIHPGAQEGLDAEESQGSEAGEDADPGEEDSAAGGEAGDPDEQ